jgi:predicted small lipoprotein YifL
LRRVTWGGRPRLWLFLVMAVAPLAGCSSKGALKMPDFSPAQAAAAAMSQYDKNKDGVLDATELEQSPALKSAFKTMLAKNKSAKISADEIAERLRRIQEAGAIINLRGTITLNDRPLSGAKVTLVPEPFMGPAAKPASGETDAQGTTIFRTEGLDLPGAAWGLYRVEVSKKNGDKESIPRRYNTETVLGLEIGPDFKGQFTFNLTGS